MHMSDVFVCVFVCEFVTYTILLCVRFFFVFSIDVKPCRVGYKFKHTSLHTLQAGAVIMTLGAMVAHPEISIKIIPVGLNYFGGDRFRSRIYVDYGRYCR